MNTRWEHLSGRAVWLRLGAVVVIAVLGFLTQFDVTVNHTTVVQREGAGERVVEEHTEVAVEPKKAQASGGQIERLCNPYGERPNDDFYTPIGACAYNPAAGLDESFQGVPLLAWARRISLVHQLRIEYLCRQVRRAVPSTDCARVGRGNRFAARLHRQAARTMVAEDQ